MMLEGKRKPPNAQQSTPTDQNRKIQSPTRTRETFLFEQQLDSNDVERRQIRIPWEKAEKHFPPHTKLNFSHEVLVSDTRNESWTTKAGYALKFLFQKELTRADVTQKFLRIPIEEAEKHFPPLVKKPDGSHKEEGIMVCDPRGWWRWMKIRFSGFLAGYVIAGEDWSEYVSKHELHQKDVIRFFKVVKHVPAGDKHYYVDYLRAKEAVETNVSPSGKGGGSKKRGGGEVIGGGGSKKRGGGEVIGGGGSKKRGGGEGIGGGGSGVGDGGGNGKAPIGSQIGKRKARNSSG